jgi:hypothetical protein
MPGPAITRHPVVRCDAGQVTGTGPRPLADLTEAQRDQAMARWQVLRPHIEDGAPTARLAGQCGVARHADPRTTRRYDRGRHSLDRHAPDAVTVWLSGQADDS